MHLIKTISDKFKSTSIPLDRKIFSSFVKPHYLRRLFIEVFELFSMGIIELEEKVSKTSALYGIPLTSPGDLFQNGVDLEKYSSLLDV